MTPAARVAAAIEILDEWLSGLPAEQALTSWARRSRFAGSKDRAAVRDHVFDVLRVKETAAALGGGTDGRALMIGVLRHQGVDVRQIFTGQGFAPDALEPHEKTALQDENTGFHWNLPDWLSVAFQRELGEKGFAAAKALTNRAPVSLRVNMRNATLEEARRSLARDGVSSVPNPLSSLSLTVTDGARRVRQSQAYVSGVVELQDAASQAVVACLPAATRCLDYCAGGGGKALALAADTARRVTAHDIDAARMRDIAPRASRAGVQIEVAKPGTAQDRAPFDLVLCDVPCSGSGAWRRSPDAKWRFTEDQLNALRRVQQDILSEAVALVSEAGWAIYVTCSILPAENETAVETFLERHPEWTCCFTQRFDISADGDGFFTAHFRRRTACFALT